MLYRISTQRFEKLADDCVEVFANFLKEKFYYPTDNTQKCAGGCLYVTYLKIREKYLAIDTLSNRACKKKNEGNLFTRKSL